MPLFLCFRGGAVRFFVFLGLFLTSCVFFVGLCPFGNKFLFIQKKKKKKRLNHLNVATSDQKCCDISQSLNTGDLNCNIPKIVFSFYYFTL